MKFNLAEMKMYLSRVNKLTLMKLILSNVNLYIFDLILIIGSSVKIYFPICLPIRYLLKHVPIYLYKIGCCTLKLCELKLIVKKNNNNLPREKFACCSLG